jgi:hypothetical protein
MFTRDNLTAFDEVRQVMSETLSGDDTVAVIVVERVERIDKGHERIFVLCLFDQELRRSLIIEFVAAADRADGDVDCKSENEKYRDCVHGFISFS